MRFDFDLLTIGAGSGGVAATRRAGNYGARTAICEEDRVGGTCVLRGCIPKKFLVYASHFAQDLSDSIKYGWSAHNVKFDWHTLITNKDAELDRLHDIYQDLLDKSGVKVLSGKASLLDEHTVAVESDRETKKITAETILVATGGSPQIPDNLNFDAALTSNEALSLDKLPERIIVVGGGYIAVEFCGIFNSLGVEVTEIIRADRILRGFDEDVRGHLQQEMARQGIQLITGVTINKVDKTLDVSRLMLSDGRILEADEILFATGRIPNTNGLGLEVAGVALSENGAIKVDEWSRTSCSNIYAIGDCTDRINLTPVAISEGRALADSIYNNDPKTVDYENVASAVFSQPPVGTVGMTEAEARQRYRDVTIYQSEFRPLKATISGDEGRTMMKLIVEQDSRRVVGCHMVGDDAPEIIQGLGIALKCGATKEQFDATMAIHPTAAEEFVTMYDAKDNTEK
jgi:glutathione reductase (NADPH)